MITAIDVIIAGILAIGIMILFGLLTDVTECLFGCIAAVAGLFVFIFYIGIADDTRCKRFFKKYDGLELFCYTSRKRTRKFIEERILPNLPQDMITLFKDRFDFNAPFKFRLIVSHIRGGIPGKKYPYLLKVSEGRIISISLSDAVHMNYRLEDGEARFFEQFNEALNKMRNEPGVYVHE